MGSGPYCPASEQAAVAPALSTRRSKTPHPSERSDCQDSSDRSTCPMDLLFEACDLVRPANDSSTSPVSSASDPSHCRVNEGGYGASTLSADRSVALWKPRQKMTIARRAAMPIDLTSARCPLSAPLSPARRVWQSPEKERLSLRAGEREEEDGPRPAAGSRPLPQASANAVHPCSDSTGGAAFAGWGAQPLDRSSQAPTAVCADVRNQPKRRLDASARVHRCTFGDCGKLFARTYNLKAHLRVHTRELPYVCSAPGCAKRFRWRSSLTSHARFHLQKSGTNTEDPRIDVPSRGRAVDIVVSQGHQYGLEAAINAAPALLTPETDHTPFGSQFYTARGTKLSSAGVALNVSTVGRHSIPKHDIPIMSDAYTPSARVEGGLSVRSLCH
jgi:Zinc finger, C2H2 type